MKRQDVDVCRWRTSDMLGRRVAVQHSAIKIKCRCAPNISISKGIRHDDKPFEYSGKQDPSKGKCQLYLEMIDDEKSSFRKNSKATWKFLVTIKSLLLLITEKLLMWSQKRLCHEKSDSFCHPVHSLQIKTSASCKDLGMIHSSEKFNGAHQ